VPVVVNGPAAALVAGLTVAACGSANNGGSFVRMNGGDAGFGGGGPGDASSLDASSCHPGDVEAFVASYHPAVPPQAVCLPQIVQPNALIAGDPITLFYDACFGPHKSPFACGSFAGTSPAYAACAACIETSASASSYGPLVVDPADGFVRANVGGCIELTDPLALSCAKAAQAQQACQAAACAVNCPVTDDTSLDAYNACADQAAAGGCETFTAAASCVDAEAVDLAACSSTSFQDFYFAVVPMFCGVLPVDAAAPADASGGSSIDGATRDDAEDGVDTGAVTDGGYTKDATTD
jgi:hypothetical protein